MCISAFGKGCNIFCYVTLKPRPTLLITVLFHSSQAKQIFTSTSCLVSACYGNQLVVRVAILLMMCPLLEQALQIVKELFWTQAIKT